jgi:hypothetical protein
LDCVIDLGSQLIKRSFGSHRAEVGFKIIGISNHSFRLNLLNQSLLELIINLLLYDESLRINSCLTVAVQSTFVGSFCSSFHIRVLQNDERVVSTQFKCCLFHIVAASFSDNFTCFVITNKLNSANASVFYQIVHLVLVDEDVLEFAVVKAPKIEL